MASGGSQLRSVEKDQDTDENKKQPKHSDEHVLSSLLVFWTKRLSYGKLSTITKNTLNLWPPTCAFTGFKVSPLKGFLCPTLILIEICPGKSEVLCTLVSYFLKVHTSSIPLYK